MKNGVYLLLGSNLGNREENLFRTIHAIQQLCVIVKASSRYQTQAWGNTQQPDFLNQVVQIDFKDSPRLLLRKILAIENEMGRVRTDKWGSRIIDIDILFMDQTIVSEPDLTIPHSQLHVRRFALLPLAEIAPEFIHPILKKSCKELLNECNDSLRVERYEI